MGTSASYQLPIPDNNKPMSLSQTQLDDLARDLGLSKGSAQLRWLRVAEDNFLASGTTYFLYRKRDEEFHNFCFTSWQLSISILKE